MPEKEESSLSQDAIEILAKHKAAEKETDHGTTPVALVIFLVLLIATLIVMMLLAYLFKDQVLESIKKLNDQSTENSLKDFEDNKINAYNYSEDNLAGEVLSAFDSKSIDCSYDWTEKRSKEYVNSKWVIRFDYPERAFAISQKENITEEIIHFNDNSLRLFSLKLLSGTYLEDELVSTDKMCYEKASIKSIKIGTKYFKEIKNTCNKEMLQIGIYLDRSKILILEKDNLTTGEFEDIICSIRFE